jgi:hypothetical protein
MGVREERIPVVLAAAGGQAGLEEATRKELAADGVSPILLTSKHRQLPPALAAKATALLERLHGESAGEAGPNVVKQRCYSLRVGDGLDAEPLFAGDELSRQAARHLWRERFPAIPFEPEAIYDWLATKNMAQWEAANLTYPEVCTMLRGGEPAPGEPQTEAAAEQGAAPTEPQAAKSPLPESTGRKMKATVNARIIDLLKDPTTHTWSAQQFAEKLGCAKGTVGETPAWKQLHIAREMKRQKRAAKKQEAWQERGGRPNVR